MSKLTLAQYMENTEYHLTNLFGSMSAARAYFAEYPGWHKHLWNMGEDDWALGSDPHDTAARWWSMKLVRQEQAAKLRAIREEPDEIESPYFSRPRSSEAEETLFDMRQRRFQLWNHARMGA